MVRRYFTPTELAAVEEAQRRAEELTGEHFKLGSFDLQRYPYEVVTLQSLGHDEVAPLALAQLLRYGRDRQKRPPCCGLGLSHFYRIGLQDANVLERAEDPATFEALLLYVLTHELVHIVRFEQFAESFHADPRRREREERRVHEISGRIVRALRLPVLDAIAARYAQDTSAASLCGGS